MSGRAVRGYRTADLRLRRWVGAIIWTGLLLAPPAFGEGPAEVFSHGGQNCPASDVDLDSKPTPSPPDFGALAVPINPALLDWPVFAQPTVPIIPVGVDSSTRYFNFENRITPMLGVSADVACHLHLGNGSDICTVDESKPSNYRTVLTDAAAKGLNKIRLVVAFNGIDHDPAPGVCHKPVHKQDQPFLYVPGPGGALGYWRLDKRNKKFFDNVRKVVQFAHNKKLFVEVTFFAPWFGVWEKGPWHQNQGRIGANLEPIGFASRSDFVRIPPSGDTPAHARLREAQKNVIRWTINALWDLPRVYWEIANEPENPDPSPTADCDPTDPPAVDAAAIRSWQEMMINEVVTWESRYVRPNMPGWLHRPHLIAVQPFSLAGAGHYISNPNVAVINGHYTRVRKAAPPDQPGVGAADLGAIELVRSFGGSGRILGFNEGKISGIIGGAGTVPNGGPESARTEAWEFALNRGATFDHFGYNYSSSNGAKVREQLGKLRSFLGALPLRQLVVTADPPAWVDLARYDDSRQNPTYKYWAALEPAPNATSVRTYVVYIHHSRARQLAFDGYDPIFRNTPPYYNASEVYRLCLGSTNGTYEVEWICPEKNEVTGSETVQWTGSTTCAHGGPGSVQVQPPAWPGGNAPGCHYTYDIALRIRKTG